MEVEKYFENLASMLMKEGEQDLASVQTSKESESNESNLHNEEDENIKHEGPHTSGRIINLFY